MYQRDKHHRPVCYYDVDKLKDLQDKPAVMTDSILHMLNYAMEHLLVPGHVE
jgi:CRAL/TRIO domain